MRIALVVTGGVDPSGRERVVPTLLWLIERLARRHTVHVFALHHLPEPRTYPLLGATVHDLGRVEGPRGFKLLRMRRRLASALKSHGPFDIVHAYWGMPAGFVATGVARAADVPTVVTFDSGELARADDIGYGLQRRLTDRLAIDRTIRRATCLTVTTGHMARMPRLASLSAPVIPLGVDPDLFPVAPRPSGPPWRLLRVASLNPVKGYPLLLEALQRLIQRLPDVHLDIVGEDTLQGNIQAKASQLGLERHITFHGFQPTEHLSRFYARAHLHLVTSHHEAGAVVVLEAASTGLPTVGTAVGYVADWSPQRAVAIAGRDPQTLATAIADLLRDPERRLRLGEAARGWALAHDADWTARAFERLYTEVVASR